MCVGGLSVWISRWSWRHCRQHSSSSSYRKRVLLPVQTKFNRGDEPHCVFVCVRACVCVCVCHQSPGCVLSRWVMRDVSTPRPGWVHTYNRGFSVSLWLQHRESSLIAPSRSSPSFPVLRHKSKTRTFIGYSACICKISSCLVWACPQHFCGWAAVTESILGTSGENIENSQLDFWVTHWGVTWQQSYRGLLLM